MPERHLLYLLGGPGAGKSTLAGYLVGGQPREHGTRPVAHEHYPVAGVVQLGHTVSDWPGTDTLPNDAIGPTLAWLTGSLPYAAPALVLAEGDRLANTRFFDGLLDAGWQLLCAHLAPPPWELAERRKARSQHPAWVKGRDTKHARLAHRYDALVLDSGRHRWTLCEQLAQASPVAAALLAATEVR